MAITDPIGDMLTRIRNAQVAKHDRVDVPASQVKEEICRVLLREGYIRAYQRIDDGRQGILQITLKYEPDGTPVIRELRRVSKPSLRVYIRCDEIRPVRTGLGISILSTCRGVMTGKEAREANVGGEVLCEVW